MNQENSFTLKSINISAEKGVKKTPVEQVNLIIDYGIENDAHHGDWHRQVSLLAQEDIDTMKEKGLDVSAGDFAENITTLGVDLSIVKVGSKIHIDDSILEITQIGKVCHDRCHIYYEAGDCIMPRKGIFAKVLKGGNINLESSGFIIV